MSDRMIERVRQNNNQFWATARQLHLDEFMRSVYESGPKKELIKRWLKGGAVKRVLIRQMNFYSDPLLIEFRPDSFMISVLEGADELLPDVEVIATHTAIISYSTDFLPCVRAWLRRELKVPQLTRNPADHYFAAKIFLGR